MLRRLNPGIVSIVTHIKSQVLKFRNRGLRSAIYIVAFSFILARAGLIDALLMAVFED